jgi:hypothetical protein
VHAQKTKAIFASIWKLARRLKYTAEASPADDAGVGRKTGHAGRPAGTVPRHLDTGGVHGAAHLRDPRAALEGFLSRNDFLVVETSRSQLNDEREAKTLKSKRAIPIGHLKAAILPLRAANASPDDLIFDLEYGRILDHIKTAGKQVGITYKGFGCHALRRLHNTWFRSGGTVDSAMEQLGHTSKEMNGLYFVENAEDLRISRSGQRGVRPGDVRRRRGIAEFCGSNVGGGAKTPMKLCNAIVASI